MSALKYSSTASNLVADGEVRSLTSTQAWAVWREHLLGQPPSSMVTSQGDLLMPSLLQPNIRDALVVGIVGRRIAVADRVALDVCGTLHDVVNRVLDNAKPTEVSCHRFAVLRSLLTDMTNQGSTRQVAQAKALQGFLWWWHADDDQAWGAADESLGLDPDCSMARLIKRCLTVRIKPRWLTKGCLRPAVEEGQE